MKKQIIQSLTILLTFSALAYAQDTKEAQPAEPAQKDDVIALFDGTDLEQWRGYQAEEVPPGWSIVDGTLRFDGEKRKKKSDLVTKEIFRNFELTFDWKVTEGANSGVMYRVGLGDRAPYLTGAEYQVLDDAVHHDGKEPTKAAGSLYALYEPQNKTLQAVGEWNSAKIVLNGKTVEHWLNGVKVVSAEIDSDEWNEKVAASKFATWEKFATLDEGHLAFQDHGDVVFYRNIHIRRLADDIEK